jgi:16S rRNA (guanine966-N2)-methyltransferase
MFRAVRIIGGAARGRALTAPRGEATRPTADRVREAIFNILGPPPERVLDLYAGSGALGLEAVSRGAKAAVLVDHDARAIATIRRNIEALGREGAGADIRAVKDDACRALSRLQGPFGWVFVDPPYASGEAARVLAALAAAPGLLSEGATVIVEHDKRSAPPERVLPLFRSDVRGYGDTRVAFYSIQNGVS